MSWSLLPTISAPMPFQMALDELIFESQKKDLQAPLLRFYDSSEPWISVGCSFKGTGTIFQDKKWSQSPKICLTPLTSKSDLILKNPRVPICRRITGGGCVLHGHDLIFSLVAGYAGTGSVFGGNGACPPSQNDGSLKKGTGTILKERKWSQSPLALVRTSYAKIHEGVKMGLQTCGFDPKFYSCGGGLPKGSDCFDFPVESDLSWRGKKIAGGAQKRSGGVLLHHESVQASLGVVREDLIRSICQGMEKVFGVSIQNADLDPDLYFQAEKLTKTTDPRPETRD